MKDRIKQLLAALGYEVRGTRMTPRQLLQPKLLRALEFDDVICRLMVETGNELSFIQVGAFDGVVQDPLRKYIVKCGWRGVMVEPQAGPASKLRELYAGNEKITIMQAAVDASHGERTLFTVDSEAAPAWAGGLASFDRDTIVRHSNVIPGLERMIKEQTVTCIPFEDIIARLPSGRVDLLQMDAEGADGYLLSLFPFARLRPAIIHWEVKHLGMSEREKCLALLAYHDYRFAPSGSQDMLAVLR